jgi:hypothetical protein
VAVVLEDPDSAAARREIEVRGISGRLFALVRTAPPDNG